MPLQAPMSTIRVLFITLNRMYLKFLFFSASSNIDQNFACNRDMSGIVNQGLVTIIIYLR